MKQLKFFTNILFVSLLVCSCVRENIEESQLNYQEDQKLSILEAQDYFESLTLSILTRCENTDASYKLNPGDFTPLWDKATELLNDKVSSVDIPLMAHNRYKILRTENINGQIEVYKSAVTQKLVVSKNLKTGKISSCLMTYIPSYIYAIKNKGNISNKVLSLDMDDFSGFVIYSLPYINYAYKIEKYDNGSRIKKGFITNNSSILFSQINEVIGCIRIAKCNSIQTRFGEDYDDFWDWFEDEIFENADDGDSFTVENDGDDWWFENQDGERYDIPDDFIDTDNDDNNDGDDWGNDNWDDEDINEPWHDNTIPDLGPDMNLLVKYEDADDGFWVYWEVYHKKCGSYLGWIDPSESGTATFHCSVCNVDVTVRY